MGGFKGIATNTCVVDWSSSLFFESRFIYQLWKPTAPNIFTGRRIQNWESMPIMMKKDSAGEVIRKAYPEIKSECSQRIKYIIGVTQTNPAVLDSTSNKVFSKVSPKGKRDILNEEVRRFDEEQRTVTAVTQAKQCVLTKWNIEPINYRRNP